MMTMVTPIAATKIAPTVADTVYPTTITGNIATSRQAYTAKTPTAPFT
jgi:hypothetical protein